LKAMIRWAGTRFAAVLLLAGGGFAIAAPASAAPAPEPDKSRSGTALSKIESQSDKTSPTRVTIGAVDAAPLKFETGTSNFSFPLQVQSNGPGKAIAVTVLVRPLWSPDGKPFAVTCQIEGNPCAGASFDIEPAHSIEATVALTLGGVGTYTAWVILRHASGSEGRLVEIKRVLVDPTFGVMGSERASDAALWVTIVDVAGQSIKLARPEILNLTRNQKDKPSTQAKFKILEILDESGKPLEDSFDLAAGQSRRLTFEFVDLEPGEYSGKLHFAALAGSKPVEFEIKQLTARWDWWCALVPILLGAVVSHFLREWATRYRPMLVKRQSIVATIANLDDAVGPLLPLDQKETRAEASVRQQLDVLERTLDADDISTVDANLAALARKVEVLPLWLLARRRVDALEPPSLRVQFEDVLQAGERFFANPHAEATDTSIQPLRDLDGVITKAVREEMRKQVGELRGQVNEQIKLSGHPAHRDRLTEKLLPLVAKLEDAVERDASSVRDLLEIARAEFARAMIDDLRQTIQEPAPATVEDQDWAALKDKVAEELNSATPQVSAQALAAKYASSLRTYLDGLTGLLAKSVKKRKLIVGASNIGEKDKAGFLTDLESLGRKLEAIARDTRSPEKQQAATVQLEDVMKDLDTLAAKYFEVAKAPLGAAPQKGSPAGLALRGALIPPGFSDGGPQKSPQFAAKVDQRTRAERLRDWIRTGDGITTLAAGAIALALGLKAVWIDNPGWGGFDDWLVAALWGLGLHQGASGVFEGIAGLKRKFS
jgi:hypothetical protein